MVKRNGLVAITLAAALQAVAAQEHQHNNEATRQRLWAALDVREGAVVADVGAGDGGYSVPLAKAVGATGRVVSVDISPRALERLRARVAREGLTNVEVVQGDVDNPKLPAGSLDGVLIVNAYHEMTQYQAMLAHIRAALKQTGRLVIVDFSSLRRRAEPRQTQTTRHEIAPELVQQEVRAAGFKIIGFEDPLDDEREQGSDHVKWLLTAVPAATVPVPTASSVTEAAATPSAPPERADLSSPALRIAFNEFLQLYREKPVIVLDVRDSAAVRRGRIPNARLAAMGDLRDLVPELMAAKKPIVAYCECPAEETSARAVAYLRQRGVPDVRALTGGWEEWISAGQPIEK